MIILLAVLVSIGQPSCWDNYWECTQPAKEALEACTEPCYQKYRTAKEPCEINLEHCDILSSWEPYPRCLTGPKSKMFYYLHYEIYRDDIRQIEWVESIIVPVGQPYECATRCDTDGDGDVDLFDIAQNLAYSPVRNCVAQGEGTPEQCEERFSPEE